MEPKDATVNPAVPAALTPEEKAKEERDKKFQRERDAAAAKRAQRSHEARASAEQYREEADRRIRASFTVDRERVGAPDFETFAERMRGLNFHLPEEERQKSPDREYYKIAEEASDHLAPFYIYEGRKLGSALTTKDGTKVQDQYAWARRAAAKEQKRLQTSAQKLRSIDIDPENPDAVYITPPKAGQKETAMPYWDKADEYYANLSLARPGTAQGNLAGLRFTPEQIAATQGGSQISNEEAEALGLKHLPRLQRSFYGRKFKPNEVAVYQVPITGGREAVDLNQYKARWTAYNAKIEIHKRGYKSILEAAKALGPAEITKIREAAEKQAEQDVRRLQQQSRPSVLFIDDPNKLVADIREGVDPLATIDPFVNAMSVLKKAGIVGEETYSEAMRYRGPWAKIFYPPSARAFNHGTLFYADKVSDINPGLLHFLTASRPVRSSVLGSSARTKT